ILTVTIVAGAGITRFARHGGAVAAESAARPPSDGGQVVVDLYKDVTKDCGIDFTYHNGQEAGHCAIIESLGGGVGIIDYDGDGLLDIFITGGGYFDGPDKKEIKGHSCRLYRNLGNGKFEDVTNKAGLDGVKFYSHGCAVGDYDCDGWLDLLITGYDGM